MNNWSFVHVLCGGVYPCFAGVKAPDRYHLAKLQNSQTAVAGLRNSGNSLNLAPRNCPAAGRFAQAMPEIACYPMACAKQKP